MAGSEGSTQQLSDLSQWHPGADGILERDAARAIILDEADNVLLVQGHDIGDATNHRWWFCVGGGIDSDTDPAQAACREVYEETGLRLRAEELAGPVLYRQCEFRFATRTVRQNEVIYLARVAGVRPAIEPVALSATERACLDGFRWWTLAQLEAAYRQRSTVIYPLHLARYVKRWRQGWDGQAVTIWEGTIYGAQQFATYSEEMIRRMHRRYDPQLSAAHRGHRGELQ